VGNEKKKKDKVKKGATYFMMKGFDGSYINPNMAVAAQQGRGRNNNGVFCYDYNSMRASMCVVFLSNGYVDITFSFKSI
jgi:hypothetical protein